jgi:hypothetical protein
MQGEKEKFRIHITEKGDVVLEGQDARLQFTAGEALMLLDILKIEAPNLERVAEEASPLSIKIQKKSPVSS